MRDSIRYQLTILLKGCSPERLLLHPVATAYPKKEIQTNPHLDPCPSRRSVYAPHLGRNHYLKKENEPRMNADVH
jgi:hypothetical protein